MLAYAANISQLYRDRPLAERFQRVADAGFHAYELLFPQREDAEEVIALQQRHRLSLALFDVEVDPDFPRGLLSAPDESRFLYRLGEALDLARRLGCQRLNVLAGLRRPDLEEAGQAALVVERLRRASDLAAIDGVLLTIEALNAGDAPGYFLRTSSQGFDIVRRVARPNVRFQYDYYHMQIAEGNLIATVRSNVELIGHVQIADVPGRFEPGAGEINYPNVLRALDASGYTGYVGLEHGISAADADPFAWLPREERARTL
jgi:hydroxypyruvate isomerase